MFRSTRALTILITCCALFLGVLFTIRSHIFIIEGGSMLPTHRTGDVGYVNPFDTTYERADIVIYRRNDRTVIGRIVGLPSEHVAVRKGDVYINGEVLDESAYWSDESVTSGDTGVRLGEDEYYILGDNRVSSADSRTYGPVSKEVIRGKFQQLFSVN